MASCTPLALAVLLLMSWGSRAAAATSYTVGDASGWTMGFDYTIWAGSKVFNVGDDLVFNYASGLHSVDEVSAADYTACVVGNPLGSDSSGATTVTLRTAGKHYFICGVPGHCGNGMKLAITVADSSSIPTPATPTTPSTTPTSPSCSGATPATPITVLTPPMVYTGAAGLRPAALASWSLTLAVAMQLGLF